MHRFIIGIDEAGRGPLAGPVAVGAVKIPVDFDRGFFDGIKDSKKLSEKKREEWFARLEGSAIPFAVSLIRASVIDREGIQYAIRTGISEILSKLDTDPSTTVVLLDGGLKAPAEFLLQKTIIKGDVSEPEISLAAIAAKVTRDRLMKRLALEHPSYGFEIHKGYGTKMHRERIQVHGPCVEHRITYLTL